MGARFLAAVVLSSVLFFHPALPKSVSAQAWLPLQGEGQVSVTYQNIYVKYHLNYQGNRTDSGPIRTHTVVTALEYGLTNKLTFDASIAHVSSKFEGFVGPVPHGPVDDGNYHPTFQNLDLGVRYNIRSRPVVITPFVAVTLPTHDYETRGHSAVGRGLHELRLGVNVGHDLERILPRSYIQGRYFYSIVQGVEEFNLNRSNADFELGYFPSERVALRFTGALQKTYDGIQIPIDQNHPHFHDIHDQATRANFFRLGGGMSLSVTKSLDFNLDFNNTGSGANTHKPRGLSVGLTWKFSRRRFSLAGS